MRHIKVILISSARIKVSPRRWLENAVALRGPRHESEIVIRQL